MVQEKKEKVTIMTHFRGKFDVQTTVLALIVLLTVAVAWGTSDYRPAAEPGLISSAHAEDDPPPLPAGTSVLAKADGYEKAMFEPILEDLKRVKDAFEADAKVADEKRQASLRLVEAKYQKLKGLVKEHRAFGVEFDYNFEHRAFTTTAPVRSATVAPVRS